MIGFLTVIALSLAVPVVYAYMGGLVWRWLNPGPKPTKTWVETTTGREGDDCCRHAFLGYATIHDMDCPYPNWKFKRKWAEIAAVLWPVAVPVIGACRMAAGLFRHVLRPLVRSLWLTGSAVFRLGSGDLTRRIE